MKPLKSVLAIMGVLLLPFARVSAQIQPLPEGKTGLAAQYPLDANIESDSSVIFADDFESYGSAINMQSKWTDVYHNVRIATEPGNYFSGNKAVEFYIPKMSSELSNTAAKKLSVEQDVLFFRYYSKFDPNFNVLGSSHNGASINAHFYTNGQSSPGVKADGYNKFLVAYENWREDTTAPNPGKLNVYVYYPEQRENYGDHWFPSGLILPFGGDPKVLFGSDFVARPDLVPQLGRWYCYEFMVKANSPGLRDGRVAFWVDGKLVADFPNLRLRDTESLKIDRFSLEYHIKSNTLSESRKWYDNVVVAKKYIGPLQTSATNPSGTVIKSTPTNIRIK